MINILCMFNDHLDLGPAVVTLQRSAFKVGRKLMGKMKVLNAPIYGMNMRLSSTMVTTNGDSYLVPVFTMDGWVSDEQQFRKNEELYNHFSTHGVKTNDDESLREDSSDGGSDDGDGDF
jgi:hypothetical protein